MNINRTKIYTKTAFFGGRTLQRGAAWGMMIIAALLAFEIFNFSTTDFALRDVLGELSFMGIRWATILAVAFCGIDFAGVARLFTPEQGQDEPAEVWYLFGAWLLAAVMNAMLTWWGISIAIVNNGNVGSAVVSSTTMTKIVPIFVAVMVWLIRVLIIGTFSIAGERLFSQDSRKRSQTVLSKNKPLTQTRNIRPQPAANRASSTRRPAPKPARSQPSYTPEPTYQNMAASSGRQQSFGGRDQGNHQYSDPYLER